MEFSNINIHDEEAMVTMSESYQPNADRSEEAQEKVADKNVNTSTAGVTQLSVLSEPAQYTTSTFSQENYCESSSSGSKILTRLEAFRLFKGKRNLPPSDRVNMIFNYFGPNYQISRSSEELSGIVSAFLSRSTDYLRRCKHNENHFMNKHRDWLNGTLVSGQLKSVPCSESLPDTDIISPKSKKFISLSRSQQYRSKRKLEEILNEEPQLNKIRAFVGSLKVGGKDLPHTSAKDLETIISLCLTSDTAPTDILKKIQSSPKSFTPDKALAILIDRNLSVETYNAFRFDMKNLCGFDAYPPYYKLQQAKKSCYPEQIHVSEREASVPLQCLVEHTAKRVLKLCDPVFDNYCTNEETQTVECVFRGNWGFDGSTGQSLYKQAFLDTEEDENSLFATTLIPLQLVTRGKNDDTTLWINPAPSSYRYCRPLHLQYKKETKELILSEKKLIQGQIENLNPLYVETSKGHKIKVEWELHCAAIDGKVLNTILDTPSQLRCPYCNLTSTQFNELEQVFATPVIQERLVHGISPLHSWIRALEFVLKLGYKVEVKKWRISQRSDEGALVEERKKNIQAQIREQMGLLVDVVRPNSGTTNDGNTARTAFSDKYRETFAKILNIEQWLIDDLYVILTVLSSNLPIDSKKFATFCTNLAYKYVGVYKWHPMSVTIHKILVHGGKIIDSLHLPVGMYSEQAAESRNKFWRFDREHHTRKTCREATMSDLFHRALVSSDPIVSDFNMKERKKESKKDSFTIRSIISAETCWRRRSSN